MKTSQKERDIIEACLIRAIEDELEFVEYLRQKYGLTTIIYDHAIVLLEHKQAIKGGRYLLERKSLEDNTEMVTAYFSDKSFRKCRCEIAPFFKRIV